MTGMNWAILLKNILNIKTIKLHLPVNFVKSLAIVSEKVGSLRNKAPILNLEKLSELIATNWSCRFEAAKQNLGFYPLY